MANLADAIETLIAQRRLEPGARLPAERVLAAELNVSRPTLREAIRHLASRGLLVTRRGGGSFVAEPTEPLGQAFAPLASMAEAEPGYWRDVMEIRKSLDADMAYHAALRAGAEDLARLDAALRTVTGSANADAASQARADAAFHMAIAEASHNAVLRQVMSGLFDLLRQSISQSLERLYLLPRTAHELDDQHRAIVAAIREGRAEDARETARRHLDFVEQTLRKIEEDADRRHRSSRALSQTRPMKDATP